MSFVYLPIEITARELDSRILLAYELARHGYSVYLGNKQEVNYLAYNIGNGHYLYKDHSPLSLRHLQQVIKGKNNVYCMDEEGFIYHSDIEYKKRVSIDVLNLCTNYFLWGEEQQSTLRNIGIERSDKEIITGNPRFDVLTKSNRHILDSPSSEKGYILVNSMFAAGNWNAETYGTKDYVDHQKSRGKITSDKDLSFYNGKQKYSEEMITWYKDLMLTLRDNYPKLKIYIRPHPDENHETWYNFANANGLKLADTGSAVEWIQNALCTISTGCTTTIESFALDVPVINFNPYGSIKYAADLPSQFAVSCKTPTEVVKKISELLKYAHHDLVPECNVTSFIRNFYIGDAAIKISNAILQNKSLELQNKKIARIYFHENKLKLYSFARRVKYRNITDNQKIQDLDSVQILNKIMKIGADKNFEIEPLTKKTVKISCVS